MSQSSSATWLLTGSLWLAGALLMPTGAHLLEAPHKLALQRDAYFAAQQLYLGWALAGAPICAKILLDAFIALRLWRGDRRAAISILAAALLTLAGLIVFFLRVQPANAATSNWSQPPPDWLALRAQWETGHIVIAVLTILAFAFTCDAALHTRPAGRSTEP